MKNFIVATIFLFAALFLASPLPARNSVQEIQRAINGQQLKWVAGESWVTALSFAEQQRLCGTNIPPPEAVAAKKITLPMLHALPAKFDWRNNPGNWVTSVKNQGDCGSCWDFSAVAQVEAWWKIKNNQPESNPDLSEQFILSCSEAGDCNRGGTVGAALTVVQSLGIPTEDCFQYAADDNLPCDLKCNQWNENLITIPGWGYITLDEALTDVLKSAIYRHPVSATYSVYEDFLFYAGGVYEHVTGSLVAGHAILIVGWDDSEACWICKNSWGPYWGESGYFKIKWGNCNIGTHVEFIWSDIIRQDTLQVAPVAFHFEMRSNENQQALFHLFNSSDQMLEYSVQDYAIPIKFHLDSFNAWKGDAWWCGDPVLGGYANHWLQYLEISGIDLAQSVAPELTFRGFWAVEDPGGASAPFDGWDGFNVWISADGGKRFQVIEPKFPQYNCKSLWSFGEAEQGWNFGPDIPGWGGKSAGWQEVKFDLTAYKSNQNIIRFAFASDMALCTADDPELIGVLLDDILIQDGTSVYFKNDGATEPRISSDGFGIQAAEWLTVESADGIIAPHDSVSLQISLDSHGLIPGEYRSKLRVTSNLIQNAVKEIKCDLTILNSSAVSGSVNDSFLNPLRVEQNYPNPFNLTTRIPYVMNRSGSIKIFIFNALGQQIRTLFEGDREPGNYEIFWDGRDTAGCEVSSGTYYFQISAGSNSITRKSILLK
jgi:C1A family cysteine protease